MAEKNYSIQDVYQRIGDNERLREVVDIFKGKYLRDNESFVRWWYDPNKGLEGKSPDQICKEGKQQKLETVIMDILLAAHGG